MKYRLCETNYCICLFLGLEMGMESGFTKKNQNTKTHTYMGMSYE